MVTCSIIQKSQLEGMQRLDAEYYQPEYLFVNEVLKKERFHSKALRDIISRPVVTGSTPRNRACKGDGTDIKFVKTDIVRDGEINFDTADLLPIKAGKKNSEPMDGDILMTIIGASYEIVGRASRVFADDPKMNINQNIALIRPKNAVLPGYLEAFLRSRFGRLQLWQQSRQTEQVNLNCREVEAVKIAVPSDNFQRGINNMINQAHDLKNGAVLIYQQAEDLILEELGLKDLRIPNDLSRVINFSETQGVNRIDAEYFQPKYDILISHIKKVSKLLKNIASRNDEIIKVKQEVEYKYIEISNINVANSEITTNLLVGKYLPVNAKMKISGGELLISKVRPTRGAIAIVPEGWNENYVASGAFSVFNIDSPMKEYLQVVLRSLIGKLQLEKPTTGTSYPTVIDEDIENILIPVLPKGIQQKIAELVKKSREARKKSKQLLEGAKRKVEEMIGKGSSNGQN